MATRKKTITRRGRRLSPEARGLAREAAELLWGKAVPPHRLLEEVYELLLLRSLKEAHGNYAAAAELFGPSRQSVQQYANSPLRDARWKPYQHNRRLRRPRTPARAGGDRAPPEKGSS